MLHDMYSSTINFQYCLVKQNITVLTFSFKSYSCNVLHMVNKIIYI